MNVIPLLATIFWIAPAIVADCKHQKSCYACASTTSWDGETGRWCALDKQCHAVGAGAGLKVPFTDWAITKGFGDNPCTLNRNIISKSACDLYHQQEPEPVYDSKMAYDLLLLSAAAYDDAPHVCMEHMQENIPDIDTDFQIEATFIEECSLMRPTGRCVAVLGYAHDKQRITIAFRGTESHTDQLEDEILTVLLTSKVGFEDGGNGEVQRYFENAYNVLKGCVFDRLDEMMTSYPNYNVVVTGHSLGGAVATITAYQLIKQGKVLREKLELYTFGSPRAGDKNFAFEHSTTVRTSWRVVHYKDCVVHIPTCKGPCTEAGEKSPYQVRTEVYYGEWDMTPRSPYRVCHTNELDRLCSSQFQTFSYEVLVKGKRICQPNHKNYFGIPVGTYCSEQVGSERKKRSLEYDWADRINLSNKTCNVLEKKNGIWVAKNEARQLKANRLKSGKGSSTKLQANKGAVAMVIALVWQIFSVN